MRQKWVTHKDIYRTIKLVSRSQDTCLSILRGWIEIQTTWLGFHLNSISKATWSERNDKKNYKLCNGHVLCLVCFDSLWTTQQPRYKAHCNTQTVDFKYIYKFMLWEQKCCLISNFCLLRDLNPDCLSSRHGMNSIWGFSDWFMQIMWFYCSLPLD